MSIMWIGGYDEWNSELVEREQSLYNLPYLIYLPSNNYN